MADLPEKLDAPTPILLRLDSVLDARLKAAAKKTGLGRQDIIRSGLSYELSRIEAPRPPVSPEVATAISKAQLYGVDVMATLTRAMEDALAAAANSPD
jgi:hypothetical protein